MAVTWSLVYRINNFKHHLTPVTLEDRANGSYYLFTILTNGVIY